MAKENLEKRKGDSFLALMYTTGDWMVCLEKQLADNFSDYEAVPYIDYVIKQLTPEYKEAFLETVYKDRDLWDEIKEEDQIDGNEFAKDHAHMRFYKLVEKEFDNLKPLLLEKREEKRQEAALHEKAERQKRNNADYEFKSLKIVSTSTPESKIMNVLYIALKEYKLIDRKVSFADVSRVFRGTYDEIYLDNRIVWTASVPALKYFINQLLGLKLVIGIPDATKWTIVCNCFCNKKGLPYKNDTLRNNTDKPTDKDSAAIDNLMTELKPL
jgi:hypothetical protein